MIEIPRYSPDVDDEGRVAPMHRDRKGEWVPYDDCLRLEKERKGAFDRWEAAIAQYPNGGAGCCCLFDDDQNQIQWCSVHAEMRAGNVRLKAENTRLSIEWKLTHDWNNDLVTEHYTLKADIKRLTDLNKEMGKM